MTNAQKRFFNDVKKAVERWCEETTIERIETEFAHFISIRVETEGGHWSIQVDMGLADDEYYYHFPEDIPLVGHHYNIDGMHWAGDPADLGTVSNPRIYE